MTTSIEADVALNSAEPVVHPRAPEIQSYGHIIRMRNAANDGANDLIVSDVIRRTRCRRGLWPSMSSELR